MAGGGIHGVSPLIYHHTDGVLVLQCDRFTL